MLLSTEKKEDGYVSCWKHANPLPDILKSCSGEQFELILLLASEALYTLHEKTSSLQFQEILTKKLGEVVAQKECEISSLQKDFQSKMTLEKNRTEQSFTNEIAKKDTRIRELEIAFDQTSKSYQLLNQNFLGLQTSSHESFQKNISSVLDKQKVTYESQIAMLDKLYKEQICGLQESLAAHTKHALKDNNSSIKGKTGETNFDNLVETHTSWEIENTAGTPQSCDRYGVIRGCKTLFELKNYSQNVPRKEVEKFKRDMEVHKDCPVGIFISYNTNIVGAPQDFFFSEIVGNQTFIYIQKFLSYDPATMFSILDSVIDMSLNLFNKSIGGSDGSQKIDSIKPILINEIKNIGSIINEMNVNKKFLIDTITKQNESIKHHIEKMKFTFSSIVKVLFEGIDLDIEMVSIGKKRSPKRKKPATTENDSV